MADHVRILDVGVDLSAPTPGDRGAGAALDFFKWHIAYNQYAFVNNAARQAPLSLNHGAMRWRPPRAFVNILLLEVQPPAAQCFIRY